MANSPCKGCPSRSNGCHSVCELYKLFHEKRVRELNERGRITAVEGYIVEEKRKNKR